LKAYAGRSVESYQAEKRLPEAGTAQLRDFVLSEFRRLRQKYSTSTPSPSLYYTAVGLTILALYVFSPQGRIKGIRGLKLHAVRDILEQLFFLTDELKTGQYFGFQPVVTPRKVKKLIIWFIGRYPTNLNSSVEFLYFLLCRRS
jgi:hypothetical protein